MLSVPRLVTIVNPAYHRPWRRSRGCCHGYSPQRLKAKVVSGLLGQWV